MSLMKGAQFVVVVCFAFGLADARRSWNTRENSNEAELAKLEDQEFLTAERHSERPLRRYENAEENVDYRGRQDKRTQYLDNPYEYQRRSRLLIDPQRDQRDRRRYLEEKREEKLAEEIIKRWFWDCPLHDPLTKRCCHGHLYVHATHACCNDVIVERLPCGNELYSPCEQGCCHGKDGTRVFSTSLKKCCNGKVELKLFSNHCGSIFS